MVVLLLSLDSMFFIFVSSAFFPSPIRGDGKFFSCCYGPTVNVTVAVLLCPPLPSEAL
jgi:hypothetical protein